MPLLGYRGRQAQVLGRTMLVASTFLESSGLANTIPEEIELGPSDLMRRLDFDVTNPGGVQREFSLHTLARHRTADREHFPAATAAAGDNPAGEDLDSLFFTFQDAGMHIDHVTYFELGYLVLQVPFFDSVQQLLSLELAHGYSHPVVIRVSGAFVFIVRWRLLTNQVSSHRPCLFFCLGLSPLGYGLVITVQ